MYYTCKNVSYEYDTFLQVFFWNFLLPELKMESVLLPLQMEPLCMSLAPYILVLLLTTKGSSDQINLSETIKITTQ